MTLDEIMARVVVQMTDRVPLKFILDPTRLQSNKWQGNEDELNRLNKEIQKALFHKKRHPGAIFNIKDTSQKIKENNKKRKRNQTQ